jgi:hypothetical protein
MASEWNYIFMEQRRVSKYFNLSPPPPQGFYMGDSNLIFQI